MSVLNWVAHNDVLAIILVVLCGHVLVRLVQAARGG